MNSKTHLDQDLLVSYIYNTLTDAQREVLEKHLSTCQVCRARLSSYENHQRQICNGIKAAMNTKNPPDDMSFHQIAPRLTQKNLPKVWLQRFSTAVPLAAAALGLALAIFGLWQGMISTFSMNLNTTVSTSGPFPALACFFLMFVSMNQYDRSFSIRPRFIISIIFAVILWLGSIIIGLLDIVVIRDLVIAVYVSFGGSPAGASVFSILAVFLAAMILIGVIIGGAEFHYRHLSHPSSWKLFIWTIAIQLLILILPFFIL